MWAQTKPQMLDQEGAEQWKMNMVMTSDEEVKGIEMVNFEYVCYSSGLPASIKTLCLFN